MRPNLPRNKRYLFPIPAQREERLRKMNTQSDPLIYQKTVQERLYLKRQKEEVLELKHYDAQTLKMKLRLEKERNKEEMKR